MHANDRSRLAFKLRYAARHPNRIVPHARRVARDAVLRLKSPDHVSYYRAVMRAGTARSDEAAVGGRTFAYKGTIEITTRPPQRPGLPAGQ